jgi:uncharacterized membrane protein
LWRAGWDKPSIRTSEVEKIYLEPNSAEAQSYLNRYKVKYVVIGDREFEAYPQLNIQELLNLGEIVVSQNDHYLIKLF